MVETAQSAGTFKTLLAAAKAAGLVGALSGEGPLTVFAPNDAAFATLPAGTVENLFKPENKDQLVACSSTMSSAARSTQLCCPTAPSTFAPSRIRATACCASQERARGVTVDAAKVVTADIAADNGVIHVIDKVMMPTS